MSFSNRLHNAAIGGCLIVCVLVSAASLAQQENRIGGGTTGQNAASPQSDSNAATESATTHFAPGNQVDSHTYRAICDSPKDNDHADLCQQWRMAESAVIQLWMTGFGLVLLFGTFVFTGIAAAAARAAVKEAKNATTATSEALKHQREAFARIERPYIYIYGVNQFEIDSDPPQPSNPHVKFTVANYGKTPATITIIAAGISTFHEPLDPLIVDYRDDPAHDLLVRPVISPGDVRSNLRTYRPDNMPFRPPGERDVFQLKYDNLIPELTNGEFAFVWIRIQYRGPFGDGYATNACWRYDKLTNRLIPWGEDEKYNSMK